MEAVGLLGILGLFSIEDIKKKAVPVAAILVAALLGMSFHLYYGRLSIWNLTAGLLVGLVMYIASVRSDEMVGKGDALLICVTGIFLGFKANIILLWIASMFAAVGGMIAVIVFRKSANYRMPFIPFVLLAYLVCLYMWGGRLI